MKLLITLLFSTVFSLLSISQDFTIRGFVYDDNGEPMPYEKVRLLSKDSTILEGADTDNDGLYSFSKLKKGSYIVKMQSAEFKTQTKDIEVVKSRGVMTVSFDLKKRSDVLDFEGVVVSASDLTKRSEILISEIKLDKKGLERIPGMGAENDIVGAFSVTPGVTTTGDQGGQLYVRGGTPIQNKILLDGMTIYSPFHSIGFFSVFETELIQNATILTGGFDAEYG
ncbi:MAG: carboxypeptidase regulatory-like domain-containing protein, partial [Crocinitomicaceae bacterium]